MQRDHDSGYRRRLESIGSLIFLVMILAVSIDQGQTGNNGLIGNAIESTQDEAEPRGMLGTDAKQQAAEYQNSNNRGLTIEKIKSASVQEWNKITSIADEAMKYLEKQ